MKNSGFSSNAIILIVYSFNTNLLMVLLLYLFSAIVVTAFSIFLFVDCLQKNPKRTELGSLLITQSSPQNYLSKFLMSFIFLQ